MYRHVVERGAPKPGPTSRSMNVGESLLHRRVGVERARVGVDLATADSPPHPSRADVSPYTGKP